MGRDICPKSRLRCDTAEICRMMWCARLHFGNPKVRPLSERDLTTAERYALHMAKQKAGARDG